MFCDSHREGAGVGGGVAEGVGVVTGAADGVGGGAAEGVGVVRVRAGMG